MLRHRISAADWRTRNMGDSCENNKTECHNSARFHFLISTFCRCLICLLHLGSTCSRSPAIDHDSSVYAKPSPKHMSHNDISVNI